MNSKVLNIKLTTSALNMCAKIHREVQVYMDFGTLHFPKRRNFESFKQETLLCYCICPFTSLVCQLVNMIAYWSRQNKPLFHALATVYVTSPKNVPKTPKDHSYWSSLSPLESERAKNLDSFECVCSSSVIHLFQVTLLL